MSDHPNAESTVEREPKLSTADLAGARPAEHAAQAGSFETDGGAAHAAGDDAGPRAEPLFPQSEAGEFRTRWTDIQASFVDAPRDAVQNADSLVAEAIKRLAEMFANERSGLESQWDRGDDVSTEDLRQALRRYRSFFARLLTV